MAAALVAGAAPHLQLLHLRDIPICEGVMTILVKAVREGFGAELQELHCHGARESGSSIMALLTEGHGFPMLHTLKLTGQKLDHADLSSALRGGALPRLHCLGLAGMDKATFNPGALVEAFKARPSSATPLTHLSVTSCSIPGERVQAFFLALADEVLPHLQHLDLRKFTLNEKTMPHLVEALSTGLQVRWVD